MSINERKNKNIKNNKNFIAKQKHQLNKTIKSKVTNTLNGIDVIKTKVIIIPYKKKHQQINTIRIKKNENVILVKNRFTRLTFEHRKTGIFR